MKKECVRAGGSSGLCRISLCEILISTNTVVFNLGRLTDLYSTFTAASPSLQEKHKHFTVYKAVFSLLQDFNLCCLLFTLTDVNFGRLLICLGAGIALLSVDFLVSSRLDVLSLL